MKREITVSELCRRESVPSAVYYSWLKDFMEAGKGEVKGLRSENDRLKILLADKELAISLLKKSL